jgi:uroporphyrinogen decarboxylase
MTRRERIKTIFAGGAADRCGFWLGNPHGDTWPILFEYFNVTDIAGVRRALGDDFAWFWAEDYRHPEGKPAFDFMHTSRALGSAGVFADCEDVAEVEAYPWPNPDYLDLTNVLAALRDAGDCYRAGGMWAPFFHIVADLFGMENYFVKMHTDPKVVDAVTRHVCEYYLAGNARVFAQAGDLLDGYFFGNDFGTQLDLFINPAMFDRFILPWFRQFTAQGHAHGYQVILHSCGSVHKVIDRLIDAGVDALHPIQALATGMDADSLAAQYKGRIAFMGGIDTQDLLVNGTPEQVYAETKRVMALLGPGLVVSPSHEAVLPNVPPANLVAMARAVGSI